MGELLDHLMDRAWDMGAPPVRSGRLPGTAKYWVSFTAPNDTFERHGETRDHAAGAILTRDLTTAGSDHHAPQPVRP